MKHDPFQSEDSFNAVDLLDRATAALRDGAIPEGPSPFLIARTQSAVRGALAGQRHRVSKTTAAVRIAAGVALVCGTIIAYRHAVERATPTPIQPTQSVVLSKPDASRPMIANSRPPVLPSIPASQMTPILIPPIEPALADGVIAGRVVFDGPMPRPNVLATVPMLPDCLKHHAGPVYDESLVVNTNRTLANVVVSVSDGLSGWLPGEFPPQAEPTVLDQQGCVFHPHVVAVMVGQQLLIKNSDSCQHTVQLMAVNNSIGSLGQLSSGEAPAGPFGSPEVFRVRCDVHPWMGAWVRVVDNPYFAVTGTDGQFVLRGLPPGTYTLKAWHEQLGIREQQVTITPGRGKSIDFTFRPGPASWIEKER